MLYEKVDEYENIMKILNEELIVNDLWLVKKLNKLLKLILIEKIQ